MEVANIAINALSYERTCRDRSIAPVLILVLSVTLLKDGCMDSVQFSQGIVMNIYEDSVKNSHEVVYDTTATIQIVKRSDGEIICD